MNTPLLQYLKNRNEEDIPAKGALPDKREWVDFAEFELKGNRLCVCDSWCPYDGVMVEMPPGQYQVQALCYTYGGEVRVAALRIARPGTKGERGEAVGEFGVDVGAVGITDIDLVETLDEDGYQEWMESYSCASSYPPAGRHPCPEAGTEMLFSESGWGDGWYTAHALSQDGQTVGVEVVFIEEGDEAYPFDLSAHMPTSPTPQETAVIDELVAVAREISLSTDPIDRDTCIAAFSALYAAHGMATPEFVFCASLLDLRKRVYGMAPQGVALGRARTLTTTNWADRGTAIAKRQSGFWNYARGSLQFLYDIDMREADADREAAHWNPLDSSSSYTVATTTWGQILRIVTGLVAEKLGLLAPDEEFRLAAQALATCGGAGCYERYCFISDRPANIAYPGLTPGAPAGRCRIEWRDGFVCDEALDD